MKKTKFTYLLLAVIAFLPLSCIKEKWESNNTVPQDGIVLRILTDTPDTKDGDITYPIPMDGEANRNENLIVGNKVDIFFFKTDAPNAPIRFYALNQVITSGYISIPVTFSDVENIFDGLISEQSKCNVLVVANYYNGSSNTLEGSAYAGCTKREDILNLPLNVAHWSNASQSSFVMYGTANLTLLNPKGSTPASGDIQLKRVAAKVSFNLTVASSTVNGDTTWEPNLGSMSIYMVYAMRQAVLGGTPKTIPTGIKGVDYNIVDYEKDANDATYGNEFLYEYKARSLVGSGQRVERIHNGETETCEVYVAGFKTDQGTVTDTDTPFYSYPASWDYGIATEPYLKLIIPWTTTITLPNSSTSTRTKYYYYKIPFSVNTLESNNWYRIYIDVQILGGEEPVPPVASVNYCISDWEGEVDMTTAQQETVVTVIPATVVAARYLSVPTTEYILYNTDVLTIPITSSHAVEVVGFKVDTDNAYSDAHMVDANYVGTNPRIYNPFTSELDDSGNIVIVKPDYAQDPATPSSSTILFGNAASGTYGWSVTAPAPGKDRVVVRHTLNRDLSSSDYDVAPYTVKMRIRHSDDERDNYYTDVIIEQRPPIIIKPDANEGGTSNYGYAFVNGAQNGSPSGNSASNSFTSSSAQSSWSYYLGSSPGNLSNSSNTNANMYIIETSVLPTSGTIGTYVLGDPRMTSYYNLNGTKSSFTLTDTAPASWSTTKNDWEGTSRQLSYYYPVGTDAAFNNVIAPRIRIASSFGATQPMTYYDAFRRCASYQESGYPAGRWRIPTKAEIEYIAQLNSDGKIPLLLGSDSGSTPYWCNSGYMTVEKGKTPSYTQSTTNTYTYYGRTYTTDTYVRCVYDDWYWGESDRAKLPNENISINTFTWGDQTRETVNLAQ